MDKLTFAQQVQLLVIDKGALAFIVLIAAFYFNNWLELLKHKLSRDQEYFKAENQAIIDLTKKLAEGSSLISWLAWSATQPDLTVDDKDFRSYDGRMAVVLGELIGLQAAVAALSSKEKFEELSKFAESIYKRDIEVGRARELSRTKDPMNVGKSKEILSVAYEESLVFDQALLRSVAGLLRPL